MQIVLHQLLVCRRNAEDVERKKKITTTMMIIIIARALRAHNQNRPGIRSPQNLTGVSKNSTLLRRKRKKLFKENRFCRHITSAENVFIILGLYGFFYLQPQLSQRNQNLHFHFGMRTFRIVVHCYGKHGNGSTEMAFLSVKLNRIYRLRHRV